jgi:Tol biopolymer transport system component/DNA-binding winged helix-turn-helix (wHTH) protein
MAIAPTGRIRFGQFEVDRDACSLSSGGARIKLQQQPFDLLIALLERPGRLVSRDELKERMWPADTFVDFDHSLNIAVNKLRAALNDSADQPRFIETVPRRGYRFVGTLEAEPSLRSEIPAPPTEVFIETLKKRGDQFIAPVDRIVPGPQEPVAVPVAEPETAPFPEPGRPWLRTAVYVAAGVAIVTAITVPLLIRHQTPSVTYTQPGALPRAPVERFTENLPPGDQLPPAPALAISPDGRRVAYVVVANGKRELYVRDFEASSARLLSGSQGADQPFFSPDGLSIGFFAEGKLKRVSVSGALPVTLCDAADPRGGSWAADGTIVFAPSPASPLWAIPASGGKPRVISTLDLTLNEAGHRWPHVLPGGDAVLFGAGPSVSVFAWTEAHIVVQSLKTGARRVVAVHGTYPHYINGGTLLYLQDGVAYAQAFNSTALETSGEPTFAFADVDIGRLNAGSAQFDVSSTGSLVFGSAAPRVPQPLVWADRRGTEQLLPFPPAAYSTPRLSPDGRYVAVTVRSGPDSDLWVLDNERGTSARVTFGGRSMWPAWAPVGAHLAYASSLGGSTNVFMTRVGTGESKRLTSDPHTAFPVSWSPDGTLLTLNKLGEPGRLSIWIQPVAGGEPTLFHRGEGLEGEAVFSPDGGRIAYMSNETGRNEIYVRPYPGPGSEVQISVAGGEEPVWARNGELFFRHDDEMMVADLAPGHRPIGPPARLFAGNYVRNGVLAGYDVARDGRRLLMIKASPDTRDPSRFTVVLNWQATLKSGR